MTSSQQQQGRYNTTAKTVHASFAKAPGGAQQVAAPCAAPCHERFEGGKQQAKGQKQ